MKYFNRFVSVYILQHIFFLFIYFFFVRWCSRFLVDSFRLFCNLFLFPNRKKIELKSGETYRGTLMEAEDNMNCQLTNLTFTARDGRVSEVEHVFIRGSKIRFLILPDMLKNAPMFKRVDPKSKGKGAGIASLGPVGRGRGRGSGRGLFISNFFFLGFSILCFCDLFSMFQFFIFSFINYSLFIIN
jgi:small nuclear ribonucleoprotein D3